MKEGNWTFRIRLACGCKIRSRTSPMSPVVKYLCRSGMGHSYNQPWVSYEETSGLVTINQNAPK